ncbi:hypothetical protein LP419_31740 [Massilia sp. H-1]|nr:hypothetical protein LP419_31740 [Massilia sp. H-1]
MRAAPMCASRARTKTRPNDPGPSMVQTAQPHEQAEDPMGMQRPTDRDAATSADEFADALSELPEARLVSSPARSKEVLLSDDPPDPAARTLAVAAARAGGEQRQYPEWDWRSKSYRMPGATVRLSPAVPGPMQWVDQTLAERATMLGEIRRRFELLRAQRTRVRQQLDGAEVDVQAWVDSRADCQGRLAAGTAPVPVRTARTARHGGIAAGGRERLHRRLDRPEPARDRCGARSPAAGLHRARQPERALFSAGIFGRGAAGRGGPQAERLRRAL